MRIGGYDPELSAEQAALLLALPDRPTAVFAANDVSAIATIGAARAAGLRVPGTCRSSGSTTSPRRRSALPR